MSTVFHNAWSNGQWIGLDLETNRYLGGEVIRDSELQQCQAAAVARLTMPSSSARSLVPSPRMLAHFVKCALSSKRLSRGPLRDQLDVLRRNPSKMLGEKSREDVAWSYQFLRNLRSTRPACLEDSLCCFLFSRAYVEQPVFKIGVYQPPFMAHAWVQVGDMIINDTKEVVEAYSEILRVTA